MPIRRENTPVDRVSIIIKQILQFRKLVDLYLENVLCFEIVHKNVSVNTLMGPDWLNFELQKGHPDSVMSSKGTQNHFGILNANLLVC